MKRARGTDRFWFWIDRHGVGFRIWPIEVCLCLHGFRS